MSLQVQTWDHPTQGKKHFGLSQAGSSWPVALMGPAYGPNQKENLAEAEFFADAHLMAELLEHFTEIIGQSDIGKMASEKHVEKFKLVTQRAEALLKRHKTYLRQQAGFTEPFNQADFDENPKKYELFTVARLHERDNPELPSVGEWLSVRYVRTEANPGTGKMMPVYAVSSTLEGDRVEVFATMLSDFYI